MKPTVFLVEDTKTALPILPELAAGYEVHHLREGKDWGPLLAAHGGKARALVTTTNRGADAALIGALPHIGIICVAGGHYDLVDLEAARARGIPVTHTPQVSSADVADLVMAMILGASRRLVEADRFLRRGDWYAGIMDFGTRVNGKRLGIVGLGHIGRILARRAAGFAMTVSYHGPRRHDDVDLAYVGDPVSLAESVDVLAVTCRSGPESHHVVNGAVLKALGPQGIIVSVSRGAVDDRAVLRALTEGWIGGAGLDVFEDEPHVAEAFLALENAVLLPHMGSKTRETRRTFVTRTLANLEAHFAGRPLPDPVPLEHGM